MALVFILEIFVLALSFQCLVAQTNRRCDVPADVIFLMDASYSIKDIQWEQEKNFVAALIDSLEVARYAIHVGVIVYSTEIGQIINLQPFKTKPQLQQLMSSIDHVKQGTDTAKAIRRMIEMSYNQGRVDAKQIGVVITDGRSTNVSGTILEARRARNEYNIDMIALGVGNETFATELKVISGSSSRLFEVETFSQLLEVQAQLEEIICEIIPVTTPTTPSTTSITVTTPLTTSPYIPPFPCSRPADVVFLIDGSYSISPEDWVKGKQFVSYLINGLDIGFNSIHVGFIVYSSEVGDMISLLPFRGKASLREAASGLIQPPMGSTNTALGLRTVRNMMETYSRPGVPHIAIVITDGKSWNPAETREQAIQAKAEGIVVFVVGVGNKVLKEEIDTIASSPDTLFDAPDFTSLVGMVKELRDNICTVIIDPSTPPSTVPTTPTPPAIPELCKECLVEGGVGFNPLPNDCEKYVMCTPVGMTYDPQIKPCPFGMFWSSEAVACLDARYVTCPYDKCRAMPDGGTYTPSTTSCRGYWQCTGSRSTAMCCQDGFRYQDGVGCRYDASCSDPCPLNVTIHNQGSCMYRPDPDTFYGYLEVIPGQGHMKRSCQPGQVYDDRSCSCTYNAGKVIPGLACTPAVNLTFDGSFQSSSREAMEVHQVSLTNRGSAYFDGLGYLSWPGLANKDMGDKLVVHLKYRRRSGMNNQGNAWNSHWGWGFEQWYRNASNHGNRHNVVISGTTISTPDIGRQEKVMEVISIRRNGTVVRDPRYDVKVDMSWPSGSQAKVESIQLGQLATINTPTFVNGIIYIPNGQNRILIQEPNLQTSPGGAASQRWKVIGIQADGSSGRVVESGQGTVPASIQDKYKFSLQPSLTERWFIVEPQGEVLQEGSGPMPVEVRDRYAGFKAGTLIKVFMSGSGNVEKWQISRPDGSQMQQGSGILPVSVTSKYDLSSYLTPSQVTKAWSVVKGDGTVLESGQGEIPASIMSKYRKMGSATLLSSSQGGTMGSFWQMLRPSGVTLMEGQGSVPSGILRAIKGNLFSPESSTVRQWTVTMPNGTVRTGTGKIPQAILDLYASMGGDVSRLTNTPGFQGRREISISSNQLTPERAETAPQVIKTWTFTFPNGTVQRGTGPIPASLRALAKLQNVLGRNTAGSGSSTLSELSQNWQVALSNGTVLSGQGDIPEHIKTLIQSYSRMGMSGGSLSSGPGHSGISSTKKTWQVRMSNGTLRTGEGEVPPDLKDLLSSQMSKVEAEWSVLMPDGSVKSGKGKVPEYLMNMKPSQTMQRIKRAAHQHHGPVMDLLANCGPSQGQAPSMHLYASDHELSLMLKTATRPNGFTLSLPVHEGMNDVMFMYDGVHLKGIVNGKAKEMPLTGAIMKSAGPVTIGKCHLRPQNTFRGEIDMFQMYHCLP